MLELIQQEYLFAKYIPVIVAAPNESKGCFLFKRVAEHFANIVVEASGKFQCLDFIGNYCLRAALFIRFVDPLNSADLAHFHPEHLDRLLTSLWFEIFHR